MRRTVRRIRGVVLMAVLGSLPAPALATFSIVARDAATGDLGVAVCTMAPAVGSVVPWARAGVGAVATQAFTNPDFGPRGLALLGQGLEPRDVVAKLLESDDQPDRRQVGVVSASGLAASHTGRENLPYAGSIEQTNLSVQGNILVGRETLSAMAASFQGTEGAGLRLSERLLRALEAGLAAGGDRRGRQSAALLVVSSDPARARDRANNLRVDEHPDPVGELRRLHDTFSGALGHRTLHRFSGRDVRQLQEMLRQVGLYAKEPDGEFDDATAAAVSAFRKAHSMYDGEYGGPAALVDAAFIERLRAAVKAADRPAPRGETPK